MKFNYNTEFKKFSSNFENEKKIMLSYGMKEDSINFLYEYDRKEFNSERNYYLHKEEHTSPDNAEPYTFDDYDDLFELYDNIENKTLLSALKKLKKSDFELFKKFAVDGKSIKELAQEYGHTPSNISQKIKRIKIFIKSFFETY